MVEKISEEERIKIYKRILDCKTKKELSNLAKKMWPLIAKDRFNEVKLSPEAKKLRAKSIEHVQRVLGVSLFARQPNRCGACVNRCSDRKEGK